MIKSEDKPNIINIHSKATKDKINITPRLDISDDEDEVASVEEKKEETLNKNDRFTMIDDDDEYNYDEKKSVPQQTTFGQHFPNFQQQFDMYANPKKRAPTVLSFDEDDDDNYSEKNKNSMFDDKSINKESNYNDYENTYNIDAKSSVYSEKNYEQTNFKRKMSDFDIQIKKKDMLLKLHEAEQNGYQLLGKYGMHSDIEEMEAEYKLYEQKMEENSLIDFFQDGLMFIIKGIEVLNGMYNPLNVKLKGLSDKIYDRKDKLDHVLRRLAVKYSGGTEMPPELQLLFIIGGAMIMTHLGNAAIENAPNILEKVMNSGFMNNIMNNPGLANMFNQNQGQQQNSPLNNPNQNSQSNNGNTGPSMDISNLMKMMSQKKQDPPFVKEQNFPPNPRNQMERPKPSVPEHIFKPKERDRFSEVSSVSSGDDETTMITIPPKRD